MPVVEFIQEHQLIHVKARQLRQYEELLGQGLRELTETMPPDTAAGGHCSEQTHESLVSPDSVPLGLCSGFDEKLLFKLGETLNDLVDLLRLMSSAHAQAE